MAGGFEAIRRIRLFGFGIVSAVGLGGDYLLFTALVLSGLAPLTANYVSATAAVIFVFLVSARHVFRGESGFLFTKLLIYLFYQGISISLFSWMIAQLTDVSGLFPLVVKIAVTPFSFYSNFLFMGWLTERRLHLF